ncbi:hypothetical protein E2542_SST03764 [Spatholobus suberectus]|nr:hypothetical protein E2542_SST03764 [Spatholobus suberectus]
MVITNFSGAGVGFGVLIWVLRFLHIRNLKSLSHANVCFSGFGVGCGFGVGWGFGGMPLNLLGLGAGGGCGVGVGLGWGFGTAFGSKYRFSRITFQGVEFDSKEKVNSTEFSKPSTEVGGAQ